ncbi:MAG: membrane protein insertase YidC, partial [Phycisphaerae bacterium]|nr:membrane protein insertase YidC [Gemmatimonadaceae bacterium]
MEPRRLILAVVLMAAVLLATPYIFNTKQTAANRATADSVALVASSQAKADSAARALGATPPVAGGVSAGPGGTAATTGGVATVGARGAEATPDSAAPVVTPIDTTVVETARAMFRTTNRGAALIGAEMRDYKALEYGTRVQGGTVELAGRGDKLIAFRFVSPAGDTVRLDGTTFTRTQNVANGNTVVKYDATVGQWPMSIEYSFRPDSYRVDVAMKVAGAPSGFVLMDLPPGFRSSEADTVEDANHLSYAFKHESRGSEGIKFGSLDPGEREVSTGPITWVVAKNKYFMLGVLAPVGTPGFLEFDVTGGVRASKQATRASATLIAPLKSNAAAFELYVGPQEFKRLVAMGREFETSNPYGGFMQGMIQPFATMVIRVLLWMKLTLGLSYGWILVLFGVAIRIILWPVNQKAMRSSMAMQRIQPELS